MLARLFSYRAPVNNAIAKYLEVLGLNKLPPPVKSLDEILAESESEDAAASDAAESGDSDNGGKQ